MQANLYKIDFYAWPLEQSRVLREGNFKNLDVINLLEEIESLGKQQRQKLRNRLGVLMGHFLQWTYQPEQRSKSWRVTIRSQRREIATLLLDNPSLKPHLLKVIALAYQASLDLVVLGTSLDYQDFPEDCIYTTKQIFNPDFPVGVNET